MSNFLSFVQLVQDECLPLLLLPLLITFTLMYMSQEIVEIGHFWNFLSNWGISEIDSAFAEILGIFGNA
jgi:hypothetical protein